MNYIKCKAQSLYTYTLSPGSLPNPFQICKEIGVETRFYDLGSLKGMYFLVNQIPFVVLNLQLSDQEAKIVCAHELGHHILHHDLATCHVLSQYELYRVHSKSEAEANLFAAHLLLPDAAFQAVLKEQGPDLDHMAAALQVPKELVLLKLADEGFAVP